MTRDLVVCADDFGQSAAIDRGILTLARRGRLGLVTCLVGGAAWPADAAALSSVADGAGASGPGLGLHLNLSDGVPCSPALARVWPRLPSLPRLIALAHARLLPVAALRDELQAQLQAFEAAIGRAPDVIDGHQHVHHLPQVRALLLALLAQRPGLRVRHTGRLRGPGFAFKRRVIEHTGGRALGRRLEALGRDANRTLVGAYDFAPDADYRRLVQGWLAGLPARGAMLFCHPGELAAPGEVGGARDPIAAARGRELRYLDSEDFDADLRAADVQLLSARRSSAG